MVVRLLASRRRILRLGGAVPALLCALACLLHPAPARAVTYDEIPTELRHRLPEFILRIAAPEALAALSLADLEEFADAYEEGKLNFVNEVRIEQHSGPLDPGLAKLVLQIPEGAPFIETRFTRIATRAYGRGVFSSLQWEIHRNADTSVDILLWYASGDPRNIAPDVNLSGVAGLLYGVQYYVLYYGNSDRQLQGGVQLSENFADEPRLYGSFSDNTLNEGKNGYSVGASVGDEWRTRRAGTTSGELRARTARIDGSYSWLHSKENALAGAPSQGDRISVGAGIYHQDVFVLSGDPTGGGVGPRPDDTTTGTGEYVQVRYASSDRDHLFAPKDGHSYSASIEQHVGDFQFTRAAVDLRRYVPAPNLLGIRRDEPETQGCRNDAKRFLPTASVALQAQASLASGDVPYTEEISLGNTAVIRGYAGARFTGTKLLAARAEYRMALDRQRDWEAFVFTDHALIGGQLGGLKALSSYGVGALGKLPVYGGVRLGGFAGWAFDGSDSSYGVTLGYQF